MIVGNSIAPHEALEMHELLTFKNVCATKAATMAQLVKDDELKNLLQSDFNVAQGHITELQNLVKKSNWNTNTTVNSTSYTNITLS